MPQVPIRPTVLATAIPARPRSYYLGPAIPNPFNPSTTITYTTAQSGQVKLRIYDVAGRLVRTLVSEHQVADEHTVTWNGRDDHNQQVASGVYLYRMRAGDFEETKRMVLLK